MTIAVGEALLAVGPEAAVKEIEDAVGSNMQDWGKRYPHAGYGGSFRHWLKENNPKLYGSYGNGSAMRVSAAKARVEPTAPAPITASFVGLTVVSAMMDEPLFKGGLLMNGRPCN